jgi:RND family efflux transporter MFP subunit
MKRNRALVGGVTALCAVLGSCHSKKEPPRPPAPNVVAVPVVQKDVPVYQEWIGTTDGDVNAQIRPKVDGYLLRRVYQEGGAVRKGDLLFEIDPRQSQAQLQQSAANARQAEAALQKAQHDVERDRPLAEQRALSRQELDNAISAEQSAAAALASARAALEQARLNQSWAQVRSPIAGIAGAAQAQVGDLVGPQTLLAVVSTVDPIRVLFKIGEQEYLRFEHASDRTASGLDALELVLSDGSTWSHPGRLLFAGREVDAKTGTLTMVGQFPNPGNVLRPGQYAKVRARTATKTGALLVPQRAVNELQGAYQIAVVKSDGTADVRTVRPAERVGDLWVIDEGLAPGERVVVEGFSRVKAGAPVNAQGPETAPAPAAAK